MARLKINLGSIETGINYNGCRKPQYFKDQSIQTDVFFLCTDIKL